MSESPVPVADRRGHPLYVDGELIADGSRQFEALPTRTRTFALQCMSGGVIEGEWTGVPLLRLVDAVDAPPDTTHLCIDGRGGYRTCLSLRALGDSLLATESSRSGTSTPRLVGSGLSAPRAVKNVHAIRAVTLDPGEDPQELEHLPES